MNRSDDKTNNLTTNFMPNPYFSFKQFTVYHDRCAMKTGTDAVILGAYARCESDNARILDVGTGCGIISLMLAQRFPDARITAIEIEENAAIQAKENVESSPWKDRIEVVCGDFKKIDLPNKFDLIVSNPPYFNNSLQSENCEKNIARHSVELNFIDLTGKASCLMTDKSLLSIIIPSEAESSFIDAAISNRLMLHERLKIFTKNGQPHKRAILTFGKASRPYSEKTLVMKDENNIPTKQYRMLTNDFYLY